MAGLVSQIKNEVKRAGTNKGKFVFIREGQKARFRFLTDADDGMEITFHDNFAGGVVPTPCQEIFGRDCPYCDEEGIRTRSQYAWSVWDYEAKEVKIFMFPVNNCSPVPHLISMYETYGTLCDRDYVISVSGKQQNKTYAVVPMDKVKFRNEKAKPYSEKQILKMLDKAFPCDASDGSDDEDDEDDSPMPKPTGKGKGKGKTAGKKSEPEDDWEDEEKLPPTAELEEMKPQKLYNMCKERDIDVQPKKKPEYYIDKLEQWRLDHEDEDDGDDDYDEEQDGEEDGEEEALDYSSMSPQELFKLCNERDIKVPPKKPAKFYIRQLEEYDKAQDDWGDDDEGDSDDWEDEE